MTGRGAADGGAAADDEEVDISEGSADEFEGQVLDGGQVDEDNEGEGPEDRQDIEEDAAGDDADEAGGQRAEVDGEYGQVEMRPLKSPIAPSADEFEKHCRTLIPFRDWCPICVAARGNEDPHRTREAGYVRPENPTICMDYKEPKKGELGWVVVRDQRTRFNTAHVVMCKGPKDKWIVEKIIRDIDNMGYNDIILKGDGEPALVKLMEAIKDKRRGNTVLENPLAHDPQSNGVAERAVQDVVAMARTIKLGLEKRIGGHISPNSHAMLWIVPHGAWFITHQRVGCDGRTAASRVTGRPSQMQVLEFGEQVWAKPLRAQKRGGRRPATLDAKRVEGTWVGIHDRTNEHLVVVNKGGPALRIRTVRRRPEANRWDMVGIDDMQANPRMPETRERAGTAPRDRQEDSRPAVVPRPAVPEQSGVDVPDERVMPGEAAIPRYFKINRTLVDKYGPTDDCAGCRYTLDTTRPRRVHSRQCRGRMEELMKDDISMRDRLGRRDARHGLAEPTEPQTTSAGGAQVLEPDEVEETGGCNPIDTVVL